MAYRTQYDAWKQSPALADAEKEGLFSLADQPTELESRFFGPLEFGTAGLRGIMGVGLNRMNVHVIRHATQAFAEGILQEGPTAGAMGIVICYECRNHSAEFAQEAACVMAAHGISVLLFSSIRPPP